MNKGTEMKLVQVNAEIYQKFLNEQAYVNFLQSVEQGRKMQSMGWNVEYLQFEKNGIAVAGVMLGTIPLMKLFRYCYMPRGIIMDYHDASQVKAVTDLLKEHLHKENVVYAEMDPAIILKERDLNGDLVEGGVDNSDVVHNLTGAGFEQLPLKNGYDLSKECRFVSVLNLEGKSEEDLFKAFSYHTRQDIRSTEKYCVKVRELSRKDLPFLDEMEKRTSERHQFHSFDMNFYNHLYDAFGDERIRIVYSYLDVDDYGKKISREFEKVSRDIDETKAFLEKNPGNSKREKKLKTDQEYHDSLQKKISQIDSLRERFGKEVPLSCSLFIHYGKEVIYLVGASEYEQRVFKGPYATQWYMIRKALQEGCTRYNFYGISGCFQPKEEGYGVFDFKRGFNAVVEEYIGNFILPVKPSVYRLYRTLKHE